jgi:hypothetical protein
MSERRLPAARRRQVAERALFRCEYCQTSQVVVGPMLEIDHIIPDARGGPGDESNLCLACPSCNGHKADRVMAPDPESGVSVPLFNPRLDRWTDHFAWVTNGSVIEGKSAIGRATVMALLMNQPDIVAARRLWVLAGWHPPPM